MKTTDKSTQNPFTSKESKARYNNYYNTALNQYNTQSNAYNTALQKYKNGGIGDTSYFKQGWNGATGIDPTNLNKLNTQSYNPNDNADWVKAQDDIDKNARLGWGQYNNQLMQNMIGTNMANGSGHQTAAAKQSAMLNSQLAADRANRWQTQYNQNIQNTLAANNQLGNFYNTLSNIGIDYAKLNQQDLSTLLSAYQTQSDALKNLGNAVYMGSDPTQESEGTQKGTTTSTGTTTQSGDGGWGSALGFGARMMGWM